jgi:hypothetical protein
MNFLALLLSSKEDCAQLGVWHGLRPAGMHLWLLLSQVDLVALAQEVRQGRGRKRIRLDPKLMATSQQQHQQQQQMEGQEAGTPSASAAPESGALPGPSVFGSSLSEGLVDGRAGSEEAMGVPEEEQKVVKMEPVDQQPTGAAATAAGAGAVDGGVEGGVQAGAGVEPEEEAATGREPRGKEGGKGMSSGKAAKKSTGGPRDEAAKKGPRAMVSRYGGRTWLLTRVAAKWCIVCQSISFVNDCVNTELLAQACDMLHWDQGRGDHATKH